MSQTNYISPSDYKSLNPANLNFDVVHGTIPGSTMPTTRVQIKYTYPNGKKGDLLIATPDTDSDQFFGFGVRENTDLAEKTKITGYSLGMVIEAKDNGKPAPTPAQKEFTAMMDAIVLRCRQWCFENRDKIGVDAESIGEFRSITAYSRKVKGEKKQDPNIPAILNAKLLTTKDKKDIRTLFMDESNNPIDPWTLTNVCGRVVQALLHFSSIYVGTKVTAQIYANQIYYAPNNSAPKAILPMRASAPATQLTIGANPFEQSGGDDGNESGGDDTGSVQGDAPTPAPTPVPAPAPAVETTGRKPIPRARVKKPE